MTRMVKQIEFEINPKRRGNNEKTGNEKLLDV